MSAVSEDLSEIILTNQSQKDATKTKDTKTDTFAMTSIKQEELPRLKIETGRPPATINFSPKMQSPASIVTSRERKTDDEKPMTTNQLLREIGMKNI